MPLPNDVPVLGAEEVAAVAVEDYPQKKGNVALSLIFASTVRNQDTMPQNVLRHQIDAPETPDIESLNWTAHRSARLIPFQKKEWRNFRSKMKAE